MAISERSRWAGRNNAKDVVRAEVWRALEESRVAVGPAFDRIPNFVGADAAAKRLSELGKTSAETPIATTVHSLQVDPEAQVVIEPHDNALTFIATESELIGAGVDWARVRADQFADIPFLHALRATIEARKAAR